MRAPALGSLWHISDLHFDGAKKPGEPAGSVPRGAGSTFNVRPWTQLLKYAEEHPADYLVFSGDFVDAPSLGRAATIARGLPGHAEEIREIRRKTFEYAADFIRQLADAHGLKGPLTNNVLVCPGNHDVDWDLASVDPATSLVAFTREFGDFRRPDSDAPHLEGRGITFLVLNTAYLGGTKVEVGKEWVQADPAAFSPEHIDRVMDRLNRGRKKRGQTLLAPPEAVGIVVAHHPPVVTPTGELDSRPFEIAIGAARAKQMLYDLGFRVILHGHKHVAVLHQERVSTPADERDDSFVVLGAPKLRGEEGGEAGFHVVQYAVSRLGGEARLLVKPHTLPSGAPRKGRERLVLIPPRARTAARVLQIDMIINQHGDGKIDYTFRGVPLPDGQHGFGGWELGNGRWTRSFTRMEKVPQELNRRVLVKAFDDDVKVSLLNPGNNHGAARVRSYDVCIEVPVRSHATGSTVGFVQRSFASNAFVVSRAHARRMYGRPEVLPEMPEDWETVTVYLRDPTDRLQINVQFPFPLDPDLRAELYTYVERQDGTLQWAPEHRNFCEVEIERRFEAQMLTASVLNPMSGVVYVLGWELPEEDPVIASMNRGDRTEYENALEWAEQLRTELLEVREGRSEEVADELRRTITGLLEELYKAGAASPQDKLEWAVLVPGRSLMTVSPLDAPDTYAIGPVLFPVLASYGPTDPRWAIEWRAGRGVVGRSYACNQQVVYRKHDAAPRDNWTEPDIEFYQLDPKAISHTVLYGLPLHAPRRERNDIVWGVLCVGTAAIRPSLDLDKDVPTSEIAPLPRDPGGAFALMAGLSRFASWFVSRREGLGDTDHP